jgi:hypothetical protein
LIIRHTKNSTDLQYAMSRGLTGAELLGAKSIDLDSAVNDIRWQPPDAGRLFVINKERQLGYLNRYLKKPLDNQVMLVSSGPSDLPARQLAAYMFLCAIKEHKASKQIEKMPPLWHRLYGRLHDSLLDRKDSRYSLLVISNVVDDMTVNKAEKLRDILVAYEEIPRIVVLGTHNPLQLFRNRLHYPFTGAIHIGTRNSTL